MKKRLIIYPFAMVLAMVLASCGGGSASSSSIGESSSSLPSSGTSSGETSSSAESPSSDTSSTSNNPTLRGISLTGNYRTSFSYGEAFDHDGLIVMASYSDGSESEVDSYTISSPSMTTLGSQEVEVGYTEDSITEEASYVITISSSATEEAKADAISAIQAAFNELDIDDYSQIRWNKIISKLNEAIAEINGAGSDSQVESIRDSAIRFFEDSPTSKEVTNGTWFNYHSADSNYEFDRDEDNNLVIYYDGYPGSWVYCGTKDNLVTDTTKNNVLNLTFRNDISEDIKVCLQATDDGGSYKLDSGTTLVKANETKTMTLDYDLEVSRLYFFLDSTEQHTRKGQVTILDASLTYENREPSAIPDPKTIDVNQAMTADDSGIDTYYTLTDDDKPLYIERIDALVEVNFHGNGDSSKWFGLHLYGGSDHISVGSGNGHAQNTTIGTEAGANYYFNMPISASSKLSSGKQIHMDISYSAAGLTFTVVKYVIHYCLWKTVETETIDVDKDIYVNGSGKDAGGDALVATIPYSSFTKAGRVSKMDVSFTTLNNASYGKSQIYFTGFDFTPFDSGNNNVLDIGSYMDTTKSGEKVSGTTTIYPTGNVDLSTGADLTITCWWSSATDITIDSITMYTDNVLPPEAVTGLEAHAIDSGVVLTWVASDNATAYEIYQDDVLVDTVTASYCTIDGLVNGTSYSFKVVAKNSSGSATGVTIIGTPVEGATYDTFIEGLNTSLEQELGTEKINDIFNASSYYLGQSNNERLKSVISKMQNGQETKVAYFGGSITVGETASLYDEDNHAKGYAYYSYEWMKRNYDVQNKSVFLNESICGTGSEIGIVRAQRDLLEHNPDMIFIEFAGNNGTTDFYKASFESLIRRCLALESNPAIVLVFSATYYTNDLTGTEAYMSQIGAYYGLAMFSMMKGLKAVCTPMDREDPIFSKFSDDGTHPNDNGHQLYAKALCYFLRTLIGRTTDEAFAKPTAPSVADYDRFDGMVTVDNLDDHSAINSLGSFAASDTSTDCTKNQSDVTAFQHGWKKTDTSVNEPMLVKCKARNFVLIYEAGNSAIVGDPTGNIIVSYTNDADATDTGELTWDVSKTIKQSTSGSTAITDQSSSGWENPVGVLIFDKDEAADYTISIRMEDATGLCTIMAMGYSA